MDSGKPTMINIQNYLTNFLKKRCHDLFKDFLNPNYVPQVQKNTIGDSEFTSPCATQIFNQCNKKKDWKYESVEDVAQAIIKDLKDDQKVIGEIKLVIQEPQKKDEKKGKGKKDDKKEEKKDEKAEEKKEEKIEDEKKEEGKEGKKGKDKKNKKEQNEGKKEKKEKKLPKNVYIDIYLNPEWEMEEAHNILKNGISLDTQYKNRHVAVDFSSPNIAKEMHVGHLRSTILGESICRILEFLGNKVERINHVGDWGTQFGMLIAYLESINPNYSNEPEKCGNIRDLEEFYKAAKKKFDEDETFKKTSQLKTVDLQKGEPAARKAWEFICQISRENFEKVYKKLDVHLTECGESFYNDLCKDIVKDLEAKKVIVEDKGAKILRVEKFKNPMIIVKSDGGIGYDSTDLAALNYRVNTLKADWLIYVVASEQNEHFKILFKAAELAGFFKAGQVRLDHMGFGLVQGEDGKKISTRKGGNFKLIDLLEEGQMKAEEEMNKRNEKNKDEAKMSPEYIKDASEKLGISAIKYFDLKQFRTTGYKFSFDKMLDDKGNTAVYLFYSYVRICSIYRKCNLSDKDLEDLINNTKIEVKEKPEKNLLSHLLLFNDVMEELLKDLALNLLCDYVYGIATKFSEFYESGKIIGNNSKILLTELCKRFMKLSFDLLGLTPIEKI
jgi:arginyl-tRNA synthetase